MPISIRSKEIAVDKVSEETTSCRKSSKNNLIKDCSVPIVALVIFIDKVSSRKPKAGDRCTSSRVKSILGDKIFVVIPGSYSSRKISSPPSALPDWVPSWLRKTKAILIICSSVGTPKKICGKPISSFHRLFDISDNSVLLVFWAQLVLTYFQSVGWVLCSVITPVCAQILPLKSTRPRSPLDASKYIVKESHSLEYVGSEKTTLALSILIQINF